MSTEYDEEAGREVVKTLRALRIHTLKRTLERSGITPAFELLPLEIDDYETLTVGRWGGWLIQIIPMIFNDRIVLTPEQAPMVYDHGWCYDKGGAAFLAAIAWNPETEGEPAGYKKRATPGVRQAGETADQTNNGLVGAALTFGVIDALTKLTADSGTQ